tara:strand:- start:956 stop:1534 length:579 start_codon:yes stop_codon:yes gene_type:complete
MVMQIIPTPYVGKGLLDDDDRNNILSQFAGGLLQGYNVNPTPVMGQYFTPIGGGAPMVTGGMQDQATMLTPEELDMMLQERANRLNLLNEGGAQDDFDFAPSGADPGVYDGSPLEFFSDPQGFLSMFSTPGASPFGTVYQGFLTGKTGKTYAERMREEMGQRQFADGYEFSAADETQAERDAAFDADMQDEE